MQYPLHKCKSDNQWKIKNIPTSIKSDAEYAGWLKELKQRYLAQRLKETSEAIRPQAADELENRRQPANDFNFQMLLSIPWDHHCRIIRKCGKDDAQKAFFYVRKTYEHNWSRNVLLNWLDTDLYEREGKAVSNFKATLPALQGLYILSPGFQPWGKACNYSESCRDDTIMCVCRPFRTL